MIIALTPDPEVCLAHLAGAPDLDVSRDGRSDYTIAMRSDHPGVGPRLHPLDERLLGLEWWPEGSGCDLQLTKHLVRPDGALYGGTGLAMGLAAMEAMTGRPPLWCTVQFVASAPIGSTLRCSVDVVANGRSASQVQINARLDDQLVFTAIGSTAKPREGGLEGVGVSMPRVAPPEPREGSPWPDGVGDGTMGQQLISDFTKADFLDEHIGPHPRTGIWARLRGEVATTPAKLGFLADVVPIGVTRACGVPGAGSSLDNSLRVATPVDTEWILIEVIANAAVGGWGYGEGRIWSPDGVLMATASQTARVFPFDVSRIMG
jgi:acyl-CoA thioesterase-2